MLLQLTDCGKKRKLYQEKDTGNTEDVISSLPDCILCHILSFLPTKDAVGTCILSTRWKDLWASLSNIDFDDSLVYFNNTDLNEELAHSIECVPFLNFVERVLIHRDVTYSVTRFRLSCRVCCPTRVSGWISSAIGMNVRELELFLELQNHFELPCCVFNCQSLRALKLGIEFVLKVPQSVNLPNLKTLFLGAVGFPDKQSADRLFSGCPSLEELKLIDCCWGKLESVTFSIPSLKRLRIDDMFYLWSPGERSDCTFKLLLPNLVSFEYLGGLMNEILLENEMPRLTNVTVFVLNQPWIKFDPASDVFNLFTRFKDATVLRVSTGTIKSLYVAERFLGELPVFQKLTRLDLSLDTDFFCPKALLNVLLNFQNLEFVEIHEGTCSGSLHLHDDVCGLITASELNLPRLKMITLHFVRVGNLTEMHILKDLVESAPALERVCIICSRIDLMRKNEILLKVQMLLDGSRGNFTMHISS